MTKHFRIFPGLVLGLLLGSALPSLSAESEARAEAINKLPEDLNALMESTWYCQGVTGERPYAEARDLTLSVLGKLTDTSAADRFVAAVEKKLEAGCPRDRLSTCWADYLDMDVSDTEGGKRECEFEQDLVTADVLMTIKTISGTPAS